MVPHDFVEEPARHDNRQYPGRGVKGRLQRRSLDEPERVIDRCACDPVSILVDLSCVKRQSQAYPPLDRTPVIVPADRSRERCRHAGDKQGLRHIWRDEDESAVAAIFCNASSPVDVALSEDLPEGVIQPAPNSELVQIGPGGVTETLHVDDHDRAVKRERRLVQRASPLACRIADGPNPQKRHARGQDVRTITSITQGSLGRAPAACGSLAQLRYPVFRMLLMPLAQTVSATVLDRRQ